MFIHAIIFPFFVGNTLRSWEGERERERERERKKKEKERERVLQPFTRLNSYSDQVVESLPKTYRLIAVSDVNGKASVGAGDDIQGEKGRA